MTMNCPHCEVAVFTAKQSRVTGGDGDFGYRLNEWRCPSCNGLVLEVDLGTVKILRSSTGQNYPAIPKAQESYYAVPRLRSITKAAPEVPANFAADYNEAAAVLDISPKASAALSRRLLQQILTDMAQVKKNNLAEQIEEILTMKTLPTHIADQIDMVRQVGNFAAHPIKSKQTGDIVQVEPGEAEATLATIESLFDFYFVAPAKSSARLSAYSAKLIAAGKPPLKK